MGEARRRTLVGKHVVTPKPIYKQQVVWLLNKETIAALNREIEAASSSVKPNLDEVADNILAQYCEGLKEQRRAKAQGDRLIKTAQELGVTPSQVTSGKLLAKG